MAGALSTTGPNTVGGFIVVTTVVVATTYCYFQIIKPRRKVDTKSGVTLSSKGDLKLFGGNGFYNSLIRTFVGPFVTKLTLSNHGPSLSLPHGIGYISTLQEVDLSGNKLHEIPEVLLKLKFLKSLNLSSNNIKVLPKEIGSLLHLLKLDLGRNEIEILPPEIGKLINLQSLNLMANKLESLPDEIGSLKSVFRFGLKTNNLKSLPLTIGDMEGLVELFLTDNLLESLPSTMGNLKKLFKLQVSFNSLKYLPPEMGSLPNLELFRVAVNDISEIPPTFTELDKLAWFSLGGNPACPPSPLSDRKIPVIKFSELQLGEKLGDGASGVVHLATWNGMPVAFKEFKSHVSPDGHCGDEIAITCSLDHPTLIKVLAIVDEPRGLVMELLKGRAMAEKPNFDSLLRCRWVENMKFESSFVLKVALRVATALKYLHSKGICHGDVYAHNIVTDTTGQAVLCDFGASFCYEKSVGALFEAQEVRAFGLFLNDLVQRIVYLTPTDEKNVGNPLQNLVDSCINLPAKNRLSFADVVRVLPSISN